MRRWAQVAAIGITSVVSACSVDPVADQGTATQPAAAAATATAPTVVTGPARAAPATPTVESSPRLAVEPEGLRWFLQPSGSARPVPFGRQENEVLASLERVLGPATQGINRDCGAGPVQVASWPNGLSLVFQDDRFVGWGLARWPKGQIATAAGIAPGSTRAELESAYDADVIQTSLGTEFSAGGLHGVLDGTTAGARITDMWAGVSCVAR
jgi:hypothetical protein